MSEIKNSILTDISNGCWVFQHLTSPYKKQMLHKLLGFPDLGGSITKISLLYYGHANRLKDLDGLDLHKEFNPTSAPPKLSHIIEKVAAKAFGENCSVKTFSADEIEKLHAAQDLLLTAWPEVDVPYSSVSLFVRVEPIVLGTSYPQSFGILFYGEKIRQVSTETLAVSIAHELAHHELFLVNLVDRLILPEFDDNLRFAPLQKKERPPIGRLHSLYALTRMIQAKRRMGLSLGDDLDLFTATRETFQNDELTPFAASLVNACGESIGS